MRHLKDRKALVLTAIIATTVCLGVVVRMLFGTHIREDAYITLRYAHELATGRGFVFNPNEHVLGTTTPLFALLLAGLARMGFDPADSAIAVGIACDAAAIVVLGLFSARFLPRLGVLFALLAYALLSPIVSYAVSGMETSLYTLLILATVLLYVQRKMRLAALTCALVVLTRPDGAVLAVILLLDALLRKVGGLRGASIVFVATLAPWALFAWAYFGSPIPQSVITKALEGFTVDRLQSLHNFIWYFSDLDNRWFLPLTPVFVLGLFRLRRNLGVKLLVAWAAAYSAAFIASNKFMFPNLPFEWYFVPLLALFALGVGAGLEGIASLAWLPKRPGGTWLRAAIALPVLVAFVAGYLAVLNYQHSELTRVVGGREEVYKKLAERMAEMGVQDEPVAAFEIGAFGYTYPGPVLDLSGLVTPEAVLADRYEVLDRARPPWIMSYVDMLPAKVLDSPWFKHEYKLVYAVGTWEGRRATLFRRYPPSGEVAPSSSLGVLGGAMELLGVEIQSKEPGSGKISVHLTLNWRAVRKMDRRHTVFVHLRDANNSLMSQHDGEPQGNQYPTDRWQVGETVVDKHDLVVDAARIAPGTFLVIGAYETGAVDHLLKWADPQDPRWPHELRINTPSLAAEN